MRSLVPKSPNLLWPASPHPPVMQHWTIAANGIPAPLEPYAIPALHLDTSAASGPSPR